MFLRLNLKAATFFLCFALISAGESQAVAETALPIVDTYEQLVKAIRDTRAAGEKRAEAAVEAERVRTAWETGKLIDNHILKQEKRAEYGAKVLEQLAKDLETSYTELNYELQFARAYPISPTSGKLTWSHYRELLSVNSQEERNNFESLANKGNWTVEQTREAVRSRKQASSASRPSEKLPVSKPGKLYTYKIIRALEGPYKNQLVLDLGFSTYYRAKPLDDFQPGDLVRTMSQGSTEGGSSQTVELVTSTEPRDRELFNYNAYVTDVVDGDTFKAVIDLGFGMTTTQKLRLRRLDAPEIEVADGKKAKAFLESRFAGGRQVRIKTHKADKYDRYLADVFVGSQYINQELLEQGLAVLVTE